MIDEEIPKLPAKVDSAEFDAQMDAWWECMKDFSNEINASAGSWPSDESVYDDFEEPTWKRTIASESKSKSTSWMGNKQHWSVIPGLF